MKPKNIKARLERKQSAFKASRVITDANIKHPGSFKEPGSFKKC